MRLDGDVMSNSQSVFFVSCVRRSCVSDTTHLDRWGLTGFVGVRWSAWRTRRRHHHRVGYGVGHCSIITVRKEWR